MENPLSNRYMNIRLKAYGNINNAATTSSARFYNSFFSKENIGLQYLGWARIEKAITIELFDNSQYQFNDVDLTVNSYIGNSGGVSLTFPVLLTYSLKMLKDDYSVV